jgi:gliding motility-associated-like protein
VSGSTFNPAVAGLGSHVITYSYTSPSGCSNSATQTISVSPALGITITPSAPSICKGTSTTLTASGATVYTWSPATGLNSTNGGIVTASPSSTQTYQLISTDASGVCRDTSFVTVTVKDSLHMVGTAQTVCDPSGAFYRINVTLNGTAPYANTGLGGSYAGNVFTSNPITTGNTYSVSFTDAANCNTVSASGISPLCPVKCAGFQVAATGTNPTTVGGTNGTAQVTILVGAQMPYTYAWSNGATTASISGLTAGTYFVSVTSADTCLAVTSVILYDPNCTLRLDSTRSNAPNCYGFSNGSATVFASTTNMPMTYLWSNGQTTQTLTNVSSGSYAVTVKDAVNCSFATNIVITQPTPLASTISGVNPTTLGGSDGSATVTPTGGTPAYTYLWSNGATSATINSLTAGTYRVTVTDAKGCTALNVITLTPPACLNLSVSINTSSPSCFGSSNGQAVAFVTGGTAPFSYTWSPAGANSPNRTGLAAGNVSVTVFDNVGCSALATASVTNPPLLTSSIAATNPICFAGNDGVLNLTPAGGTAPYTFVWSSGATSEDLSALASGTYTVTITDFNGCTATKSATITAPLAPITININENNPTTVGGTNGTATATVTGGTMPYTYTWNAGANLTSATNTGLSAGIYTVTVRDVNGCSAIQSVTLEDPNQCSVNLAVTQTAISCTNGSNGTATVNVTGGTAPFSYKWSTGATAQTITGLSANAYSVTVTDNLGCSVAGSTIIVNPSAVLVSLTSVNPTTNGGTNGSATAIPSGGTSPYTYLWSNGQTAKVAISLVAGNYCVTVTDANGCTNSGCVTIQNPSCNNLAATVSTLPVVCNGGATGSASVVATGGSAPYSYAWSNGSGNVTSITPLAAGNIQVTVTDGAGCTAVASGNVTAPSALVSNTAVSNSSCTIQYNGSIDLTVGGGTSPYTFAWSSGATTEDIFSLSIGKFVVTITDANGCMRVDSANLNRTNCPPVANNVYTATPINTPVPINIQPSTFDPNGDPITFSYPNGTATTNGGTWTPTGPGGTGVYTPPTGFTGTDNFKYIICDQSPYPVYVLCDTAWVVITVVDTTPPIVNHPPIANNDYGVTDTTTSIVIPVKANDSDPDLNPLTNPVILTGGTSAMGGTVSVNPDGTVSYNPSTGTYPNLVNIDSFQYAICDITIVNPQPLCDTAWVFVIVNKIDSAIPKNDPPVATDDYVTTKEDSCIVINVQGNDSDPNGDPISTCPAPVANPKNGTAIVNANGTITYCPNLNFYGQDTFLYCICDNGTPALCDTAKVVITVLPVNDPPVTDTVVLYTAINTPIGVNVGSFSNDPDGDPLSYGYGSPTTTGSGTPVVTVTGSGTILVTPNGAQVGDSIFVPVYVCDITTVNPQPLCDTGLVVVIIRDTTVNPVNNAPVANNDAATTPINTPILVNVKANDSDPDGNPLTPPSILTPPNHGTASVDPVTGGIIYTPNTGFTGNDTLTYVVCDITTVNPQPLCDTAMVVIYVTPTNPPIDSNTVIAADDYASTPEDSTVVINVKGNDSDPQGDSLTTVTILTPPTNGTATVDSTGNIVYTPNPNFYGQDTLTYVLCDDGMPVACDTAKVVVTVLPVNDPPVTDTVVLYTAINTPIGVNVGSFSNDPDGDPLSYGYGSPTTTGSGTPVVTVTGSGTILVTPNGAQVGDSIFVPVYVCDITTVNPQPLCDTGLVVVIIRDTTVNPVNNAPVANNDAATTPINTPILVNVKANDSDPDGNPLTPPSILTPPNHGTASVDPVTGGIIYTPNTGFTGNDTLTYVVCDITTVNPQPLCDTAMVVIYVTPTNPPIDSNTVIAADDYASTPEDSTVVINVKGNDSDPQGDSLTTVTILTPPTNGTATVDSTGNIVYTPNPNFYGQDTLTYVLCDDGMPVACDTAKVVVTVLPVNDPPVTDTVVLYTAINTPIGVNVGSFSNDPDGDPLSYGYGSPTTTGSGTPVVTVTGSGTILVTPNGAQVGDSIFVPVYVCDITTVNPQPLCDTGLVVVIIRDTTVNPVNNAPVANNDAATTPINTPILVNVKANDSDPDGNPLTPPSILTPPNHGTASVDPVTGGIIYTPNTGFTGNDTLTYVVCDITTVNPQPLCDTAMVVIYVTPTNPPIDSNTVIAADDYASTPEDSTVVINVKGNDSDPQGDSLTTVTILTPPTNGTATVDSTGNIVYTPNPNFYGQDTLTYVLCDDGMPVACDTAKVVVTVLPVNDPPVTDTVVLYTAINTPIGVNVGSFSNDPDGDPLSYGYGSPTTTGSGTPVVTVTGSGTILVTPNGAQVGDSIFVPVYVCDITTVNPQPLCDTGLVVVIIRDTTVNPVNNAPVANNDAATTPINTPILVNVKANDSDPDGNPLTPPSILTPPNHGTASVDPVTGGIIYTPNTGFTGNDTLTYVVCDITTVNPQPLCDTAMVVIYVTPTNPPIDSNTVIAADDYASTPEDSTVVINVKGNDSDPQGDSLTTVTILTPPTNGTATVDSTGNIVYTPNPNFYGQDTLTYVLCDDGMPVACDTAKVVVTVLPVNDPPVTDTVVLYTAINTPIGVNVGSFSNDPDGDPLSYGYGSPTTTGSGTPVVTVTGSGTILVTPNGAQVGDSIFVPVYVCDITTVNPQPLCDTGLVVVIIRDTTVNPVNNAPVANNDAATTPINTPILVNVKANDSDPDGNPLTPPSILTPPNHGTASVDPVTGGIIYTPNTGFTGNDTLTYVVCDITTVNPQPLCDTAMVVIYVTPTNPPIDSNTVIAADDYASTPEDSTVVINVKGNDSDPQGDSLTTVTILTPPTNGTATVDSTGNIVYTPNPNFYGQDTLTYVLCDDGMPVACDTARVVITVRPINEPPVASDIYTTTPINTPVGVNVATSTTDPNGDPLTYSYPSGNGPSNGTWTPNGNGAGVYTPSNGYVGVDSFQYVVCDNSPYPVNVLCDTAWVYINVTDFTNDTMNHAPIANNDYGVTDTATSITLNVRANDIDPDGDQLTLPTILTGPTSAYGATVTVNPNGTVSFDPSTGTYPTGITIDSFQYAVCDTNSAHLPRPLCDTAWAFIVINSVDSPSLNPNRPPLATDDFDSTMYGVPVVVNVLNNDSDPDGDSIYTTGVVTPPIDGTATLNPDGTITYTPNFGPGRGPNANNPDTFTYVICDNGVPVLCDTATVVIYVPNSVQATNDTSLTGVTVPLVINVKGNDWDPESDEFNTIDILGNGGTGTANVPTLYGNATINADGSITYTPNGSNCNVIDTFRYVIRDTIGALDTATVFIFVDCCTKPIARDDNYTMMQRDTLTAQVIGNDVYKATYPQLVRISLAPAHGTAYVINDTTVVYIPNASYCGTDYLEYIISDTCGFDTANVNITVDCRCTTPIAVNDYTYTMPSQTVNVTVLTNDTITSSPVPTSVAVIGGPRNGTVSVNGDTVKYTPNAGFIGFDTIKYALCITCDTSVLCDTAYVFVKVDSVCAAPVAVPDVTYSGYACDKTLPVILNDINTFGGSITIISNPIYGTAVITSGGDSVRYTPDGSTTNVVDTFMYAITNICGLTDTGMITVNIGSKPCNYFHPTAVLDTAKICLAQGVTTVSVDVIANDFDRDGNAITVTLNTVPNHGTATRPSNGSVITYTVDGSGYRGKDTIAYVICDNGNPSLCGDGLFIITIDSCTNNAPVVIVSPVRDSTPVNTPDTICLDANVYDPNGDSIYLTSICEPQHGTVVIISPLCFVYTPDSNFIGNDTFCFTICDDGIPVKCHTDTAIITVYPIDPNQFVDAVPDAVYTPGNTPIVIDVKDNDTYGPQPGDVFTGDSIFVTTVFPGSNGATAINPNGTVTYTPDSGFCGIDTFLYVLSDNGKPAQTDTTFVIVYVCDQPHIVAVDDTTSVPKDGIITINVLGNDTLPFGTEVNVTVNTPPTQGGTATVNQDGTITYIPKPGYIGKDTFTYVVCVTIQNVVVCDTATVIVDVLGTDPCFFPNAFSPNGDGQFDEFQLPCAYKYPKSVLKVYNRWGDEVWRSGEGYKNDWDGKNLSGTDLPDGTYYYIFIYNDGTSKTDAKFVVIQRQ